MLDAEDLRRLGVGRWTVPLLAELLQQDGARFAVLLTTLGIARDSLVRTLAYAIDSDWVMRNPGYGHPLRPEYVLTPRGAVVAAACIRLMHTRQKLGLGADTMPRWSLPILHRLRDGWRRFSTLQAELAPVTARALSLTLKQMIELRMVARRMQAGFPPSTLYGLEPSGRELLGCLGAG